MLKKFLSLIGLSALAVLSGCEQGGTVDGKIAAARARNDGPAIWTVKDHDSTLYLYGTVHLLSDDLDWQRDDMRQAFNKSGTIFFEVDTGPAAQLDATVLTQSLGFIDSGRRLSDQLDGYQLKLLEAAANNAGLPISSLDNMKPWLASEFLTIAAAANAGLSPELAADEALKNRAKRTRKNVLYLDTIEGQIRASSDQPEFVQMILLTETMERFNSLSDDLTYIADAWSVGETETLTAKTVISLAAQSPELYGNLIKAPNRRWTRELTRFMEGSGNAFVAVGVSHLLGEDSLQAMFRDQGYDVSRYYAFQGENVIQTIELQK